MSELRTLLSILRHLLERALGAARTSRREREPPRIQHVNGYAESSSYAAEQVVCGHYHPFVTQLSLGRTTNPELTHRADHSKAGHIRPDEKRCRTLSCLTATLHERLRESRNYAGAMTVADPDLPAIEKPVGFILGQCRCCLDVLRIRPNLRLSPSIRSEKIPPSERRQ